MNGIDYIVILQTDSTGHFTLFSDLSRHNAFLTTPLHPRKQIRHELSLRVLSNVHLYFQSELQYSNCRCSPGFTMSCQLSGAQVELRRFMTKRSQIWTKEIDFQGIWLNVSFWNCSSRKYILMWVGVLIGCASPKPALSQILWKRLD